MSNVWQTEGGDPRDFSPTRGEQECVRTYLRNYRLAFAMKCEDLDAEALARRSVPPSEMSLLGLMRHLAQVDHHWSVRVLQDRDEPQLFKTPDDPDHDFQGAAADDACVAEAREAWRREADAAEAWLDGETDWSRLLRVGDDDVEVRDVLVHLVEEYARHAGHADLLREAIDGRTGQ